jgi:hypothetical protein
MAPAAKHRPPAEPYPTDALDQVVVPVDDHGFVRQCAWCRRIANAEGRYRLVAPTLIAGASHGCCEACAIRFLSRGAPKPSVAA